MKSGNPKQAALNLLGNNQDFMKLKNNKMTNKEVQDICNKLNQVGITKEQLTMLNNLFNK